MRFGRRSQIANVFALIFLALSACDPVPPRDVPPPGGYRAPPGSTGRAAIRAVLYTPSHGSFHTVREAVSVYLSRATEAVAVHGWSAAGVTSPARRYYEVDFDWFDGRERRQARWELDALGVWPVNNEARILTVFPPSDGR
jgi:hypothetical protein